jgi:hypothetical protein
MGPGADRGKNERVRLGPSGSSRADRFSGVDGGRDFRFILHLFLSWMSLLADNYQW